MKPFARINLSSAALRRGRGKCCQPPSPRLRRSNVEVLPSPNPISNERSGSMKLKWQKEMKWLLLAALAFLFLFERSDTLTVQDGYVRLCRRTWWFYKREVKSMESSLIGSVTHKHVYGGGVKGDSLVLKDKGGKIFYELLYRGFVEFTTWKRAHNDQKACKSAIEGKGRFSRTESITLPIPHVALVVFLLVYWYKRAWRVAREREESK